MGKTGEGSATALTAMSTRNPARHCLSPEGDGPGAAALDPKPRNYVDATWQASVTDEQISKVIVLGGAGAGKSPNMPANPDLESKPAVVEQLVKQVRSYRPN